MAITSIQQSVDQPGEVTNSARGQPDRKNEYFLNCPRSHLRIWSRETGSDVPSRVSLLAGFLPISAAASIYSYRHTPSGQSRVYLVTQLRTDGVHCRELAGTEGAAFASPWTEYCAPFFSRTHCWYEVDMLKVPDTKNQEYIYKYLNARVVCTAQRKLK